MQFINGLPMDLSPAGTQSQEGEKQHPFVLLNRHQDGGWSSVYASSRSHLIVKLVTVVKLFVCVVLVPDLALKLGVFLLVRPHHPTGSPSLL